MSFVSSLNNTTSSLHVITHLRLLFYNNLFDTAADFIVHSTTKFLNGHGTAIGGILLGRDIELMKGQVTKVHRLLGGNANPFDAFLLIQGIKTLELRLERHCTNAMEVANFLERNQAVGKVNYVGLESHPDHKVAMKQMRRPWWHAKF
jgi:methionine-gamma-lyase